VARIDTRAYGRARRRRTSDGASAVEFALVSVILFPVLFGILDYGIWFDNSLNLRQGVREAARRAVVTCADPAVCEKNMNTWATTARDEVGAITGTVTVRVKLPAAGWKQGEPLLVCGVIDTDGLTGLTPMPSGGKTRSRTSMSIESTQTGMTAQSPVPTDPTGDGWSWCT
jgi:Flp pilus assembly protein TadG